MDRMIYDDSNSEKFIICGRDYEYLKRFKREHKNCDKGMAFDKFSYTFVPTSLGMYISVDCSCGKKLLLGDHIDKVDEYTEVEASGDNAQFESAVIRILYLRSSQYFREHTTGELDFEAIYAYAIGIATYADRRIANCILWKVNRDNKTGILHNNYIGNNEKDIQLFYSHFEEMVRNEIKKYDCRNPKLLELISKP